MVPHWGPRMWHYLGPAAQAATRVTVLCLWASWSSSEKTEYSGWNQNAMHALLFLRLHMPQLPTHLIKLFFFLRSRHILLKYNQHMVVSGLQQCFQHVTIKLSRCLPSWPLSHLQHTCSCSGQLHGFNAQGKPGLRANHALQSSELLLPCNTGLIPLTYIFRTSLSLEVCGCVCVVPGWNPVPHTQGKYSSKT